jgi:uridine phosphorylase
MNQRHPDTVLFLARHLAGDPGMQFAELMDVHADQLLLRTGTPGGLATVSLPLGSTVTSRAEMVAELRRILLIARATAPDEPLTSLETDIAARSTSTNGH